MLLRIHYTGILEDDFDRVNRIKLIRDSVGIANHSTEPSKLLYKSQISITIVRCIQVWDSTSDQKNTNSI
jgi:hypothetical protein